MKAAKAAAPMKAAKAAANATPAGFRQLHEPWNAEYGRDQHGPAHGFECRYVHD
jgi:hypothetical protein